MTSDLRISELSRKSHVATKMLLRNAQENTAVQGTNILSKTVRKMGVHRVQVTSALFGFMQCLADACLTLEEVGYSLSFTLKSYTGACPIPVLLPVCLLEAGWWVGWPFGLTTSTVCLSCAPDSLSWRVSSVFAMEVGSKAPERLQQVGDEDLSRPQTVQGHSAGLIAPKASTHKSLL